MNLNVVRSLKVYVPFIYRKSISRNTTHLQSILKSESIGCCRKSWKAVASAEKANELEAKTNKSEQKLQ